MTSLERIRLTQRMTREQLAEKAGVSKDTIRNIEIGRNRATDATLIKLADALDVSPLDLRAPTEAVA